MVVPIVFGFAALAWAIAPRSITSGWTWFLLAGGAAFVIGAPAVFWLLERGTTRLAPFVVSGALFPLGAPVPGYGTVPWMAFLSIVTESAIIGASSGALMWLCVSVDG